MRWHILYRGSSSSCNYGCPYCPFAKTRNTRAELAADAADLDRFVAWVGAQEHQEIGILFTPWGEALIHRAYQRAIRTLAAMPHVYRVAIQTNLSGPLPWLEGADPAVALWTTYHPGETTRARFLAQCRTLDRLGVRYSVGVVGLQAHIAEIEALRPAARDRQLECLGMRSWDIDPYAAGGWTYFQPGQIRRFAAAMGAPQPRSSPYRKKGGIKEPCLFFQKL